MAARSVPEEDQKRAEAAKEGTGEEKEVDEQPPPRRIPVFFLDEAHKVRKRSLESAQHRPLTSIVVQLPALISSTDAMKAFLDAVLVLTKQDRLCRAQLRS